MFSAINISRRPPREITLEPEICQLRAKRVIVHGGDSSSRVSSSPPSLFFSAFAVGK